MSERCIVCDGAVVGLNFRWDDNSQHPAPADCIAHLKWKAEQAERALAERGSELSNKVIQITELLRHQEVLDDHIDALRATLARVEGEREQIREAAESLMKEDREDFRQAHERLTAERDGLRAQFTLMTEERDAWKADADGLREDLGKASLAVLDCAPRLAAALEQIDGLRAALEAANDAVEIAWGIIANAGGGDWNKETREWREAAARWRDENLEKVSAHMKARAALGRPASEP